jgi:DHA1 family bicyclomycin/chloramphenicol resistance-like MFS transporter
MQSTFARNAIVLGVMCAVGPFAIDMYLPALPTIAADLGTSTAATQMTLTSFFIAFGICQLIYGPVADMVGRKPPLYFGLIVFLAASVGCALAPSVEWLIFFRFVQGIGAAAVMVIPRAIIRDLHTGTEATRLMALVMLVISISPILAPLAGSGLIVPFGWRSVFVAVAVAALVSLFMLTVYLPETRPPAERIRASFASVAGGFGQLLVHGRFLGLTFIGGFGMASFFAFLASSSFVYIDHFGLTPVEYSLAFSVNAIGFFGASQFAARLGEQYGIGRMVTVAVTCFAAVTTLLFILTAIGFESLVMLIAFLFVANAFLGVVIPSTMVLSLEEHGPIAGMASALGGTLQMLAGGLVIVLVSYFFDGTTLPMVGAIALCGLVALLLSWVTLGMPRLAAQPAE